MAAEDDESKVPAEEVVKEPVKKTEKTESSVDIPEDFQAEVNSLVASCEGMKERFRYVSSKINDAEEKARNELLNKKGPKASKVPSQFTSEGMPS